MKRSVFISAFIVTIVILLFIITRIMRPNAEWDHSSSTLIIEVASYWGEVDGNCIPNARIWGDGRIVWLQGSWRGERSVMQGELTEEEMGTLINQFLKAGFFDWPLQLSDELTPGPIETYLWVNLSQQSSDLTQSYYDMRPKIQAIFDFASNGAGAKGIDFVPVEGYLASYVAKDIGRGNDELSFIWPNEQFGYGLDLAKSDGMWIEGDELEFAWDVVNEGGLVESEGIVYWISVQVPGISCFDPTR